MIFNVVGIFHDHIDKFIFVPAKVYIYKAFKSFIYTQFLFSLFVRIFFLRNIYKATNKISPKQIVTQNT